MLHFYSGFEINEQTGEALTDHEMTDIHYDSITSLQVRPICATYFHYLRVEMKTL